MAIKKHKPTSPGRRNMSTRGLASVITTDEPYKPLLEHLPKHSGRNNTGRITVRHQGGGNKRAYRVIDFKRNKDGVPATVATIEYDPNRNVLISLVVYADGEKRYILYVDGLAVGQTILSGEKIDPQIGNCMLLEGIPLGTAVHNIELKQGRGGQMVRSAGTSAQLVAKEGEYVTLRLPSGEMRLVHKRCRATVGVLGQADYKNLRLGKAGRKRWIGIRPTVRGSVMNPCDHPHGGGEGRAPIGRSSPVSPWGKKTLGLKTRKRKHPTNQYIVRRRNKR